MKSLAVMDFSTCSINIRLERVQYLESCIDEVPGSDGLLHMLHQYQAGKGKVLYLESCIDEVPGSDGLLHMLHQYQAGQGTVPGELF
jgi:hypothetical protein